MLYKIVTIIDEKTLDLSNMEADIYIKNALQHEGYVVKSISIERYAEC
jgi:hypothetical protein